MAFYKDKLEVAFKALNKENIDMWIIAGQESATNSEPVLNILCDGEFIGSTALIFNKDGSSCAICTPIDMNGYIHHGVFDEVIPFPVSFEETLGAYIKGKNPSKIALDFSENNPASDGLSCGTYLRIEDALQQASFTGEVVSSEKVMNSVRGIKMEWEVEKIRQACLAAEEIFDDAKSFIKAGMNCQDIYAFFQSEVERKGLKYSWPSSCNPGVFSGFGCPVGHMGAPDFPVSAGDLVNIDFGVVVGEYGCDLQRMYYILKEGETDAPQDIKDAFYTVRDAIALAAKTLVPGITGFEVDKAARDFVTSKGFDEWGSALGHQMGQVAHDGGPLLGPEKPRYKRPELIHTPLQEGYVFTLEPSVKTRCGNIGIEEDVVVRKDGAEFIVPPQQELYLI